MRLHFCMNPNQRTEAKQLLNIRKCFYSEKLYFKSSSNLRGKMMDLSVKVHTFVHYQFINHNLQYSMISVNTTHLQIRRYRQFALPSNLSPVCIQFNFYSKRDLAKSLPFWKTNDAMIATLVWAESSFLNREHITKCL